MFRSLDSFELESVAGGDITGNTITVTFRRTSSGLDYSGGLPDYAEEAIMFMLSMMQGTTDEIGLDEGGIIEEIEFKTEQGATPDDFKLVKTLKTVDGQEIDFKLKFKDNEFKGFSLKFQTKEYQVTDPNSNYSTVTENGSIVGFVEFRNEPVGGQNPFTKDLKTFELTGGIRLTF